MNDNYKTRAQKIIEHFIWLMEAGTGKRLLPLDEELMEAFVEELPAILNWSLIPYRERGESDLPNDGKVYDTSVRLTEEQLAEVEKNIKRTKWNITRDTKTGDVMAHGSKVKRKERWEHRIEQEDLRFLAKSLETGTSKGGCITLSPKLSWDADGSEMVPRDYTTCSDCKVLVFPTSRKKFLRCLTVIKKLNLPKPIQKDSWPVGSLEWLGKDGQEFLRAILHRIHQPRMRTLAEHYLEVKNFE